MKQTPPNGDKSITVPISLRLPADVAIQLCQYSEEMNTSPAKLVTSLLSDTLPAFKSGTHDVKIRMSQVYAAMNNAGLLYAVNLPEMRERVLKRAEPGGPMGRPRKGRG